MEMNIDNVVKLVNLAVQLASVAAAQYEKYKTEQGLTDEQMRQHLKELNAEDAGKLDRIIALAGE